MRAFAKNPKSTQQSAPVSSIIKHPHNPSHHLQRTFGNHAMQQLLQSKAKAPHSESTNGTTARIQPKLEMSVPGDKYEREADRVADQVLQPNVADKAQSPRTETAANGANGGNTLPENVRTDMESRMNFNLGNVRIHTDNKAHRINRALGAKALTQGNNIYFGAGQYNPGNSTGRHLIAHELVHVMQQSAARPSNLQLTPAPANMISGAWTSLGSFSWNHHIVHDHRVVLDVEVGNRSDWEGRLRNLDDSDEIWQAKGFLETAADPSLVGRSRPLNPARALNYANTVQRAPNNREILDFLLALYNLGDSLDLADHSFEETGILRRSFRDNLNDIIEQHQGQLLQEISAQGQSVSSTGITGIVGQTSRSTVMSMIQNSAATAMKAIDLITTAKQSGDTDALSNAQALIRNSGRTIRYTLNAHAANVAFNYSVAQGIFDTVWSTIPGGGALASAGMELLKLGFSKMLEEASKDDEPAEQAQKVLDQFIEYVRRARREGHFGSGEISVLIESTAITGFEAAMR